LKRDRDGSTAPKNFFEKVLTETEIALYCSACFGEMPKRERKFKRSFKIDADNLCGRPDWTTTWCQIGSSRPERNFRVGIVPKFESFSF
jgi:hypothetical protein